MRAYRVLVYRQVPGNVTYPAAVEGLFIYLLLYAWLVGVVFIRQLKAGGGTVLVQAAPALGSVFTVAILADVAAFAGRATDFLIVYHMIVALRKDSIIQRIQPTTKN